MLASGSSANTAGGPIEITVLYNNYTLTEGCTPDRDFACIIKGTEKCIDLPRSRALLLICTGFVCIS